MFKQTKLKQVKNSLKKNNRLKSAQNPCYLSAK